jgi:hypothetical protein
MIPNGLLLASNKISEDGVFLHTTHTKHTSTSMGIKHN